MAGIRYPNRRKYWQGFIQYFTGEPSSLENPNRSESNVVRKKMGSIYVWRKSKKGDSAEVTILQELDSCLHSPQPNPQVQFLKGSDPETYWTLDAGQELYHWLYLTGDTSTNNADEDDSISMYVSRSDWRGDGKRRCHFLCWDDMVLKLLLGCLKALNAIHSKGLVHLDGHLANWVISAEFDKNSPNQANFESKVEFKCRIDVSSVCLIDFDRALWLKKGIKANSGGVLEHYGVEWISPRLKNLYENVKLSDPQMRDAQLLAAIDWREDLYQLGFLIDSILTGNFFHRETSVFKNALTGGGVSKVKLYFRALKFEPFFSQKEKILRDLLRNIANELLQYGKEGECPKDMPHLRLIANINQVLIEQGFPIKPVDFTFSLKSAEAGLIVREFKQTFQDDNAGHWPKMVAVNPHCRVENGREMVLDNALAVSQDPITVKQFLYFVREKGYHQKPQWQYSARDENRPMTFITHDDCLAWLAWLNAQLPDQCPKYRLMRCNEWEYCCFAGNGTGAHKEYRKFTPADGFFKYNDITEVDEKKHDEYVTLMKTGPQDVNAVQNATNLLNLRGLYGNVWELVEIPDDEDGLAKCGGCYNSSPIELVVNRSIKAGSGREFGRDIGFRVCRELSAFEIMGDE